MSGVRNPGNGGLWRGDWQFGSACCTEKDST
jgi:hypothetical protein